MSSGLRSDVGCKTVANMIKGKTPEEIRKLFNIVNDFTPEEEVRSDCLVCSMSLTDHEIQAQIKKENVSSPPSTLDDVVIDSSSRTGMGRRSLITLALCLRYQSFRAFRFASLTRFCVPCL